MPIPHRNDGDEVRATGYVAIYAAYVEEFLGECFQLLKRFDPKRGKEPWQSSLRIESCRRAIATLPRHETLAVFDAVLADAKGLLRSRNFALHIPIYGLPASGKIKRGTQPNAVQKFITAEEIYDLAEALLASARNLMAAPLRLASVIRDAPSSPQRSDPKGNNQTPDTRNAELV
jgi:hypothetical protein